ncbi:GntR family transcriptional regulator [Mesoaciditoga sp.]
MKIDYHSDVPVYKQIITEMVDSILSGALKEGEELPSIRKMALDLNVNPNTIAKAYMILQEKGYIYSIAGVGYKVAKPPRESAQERLNELEEEMRKILKKMSKFPISGEELQRRLLMLVKEVIDDGNQG